jgi:2-phosphosulfolactate phosphatase
LHICWTGVRREERNETSLARDDHVTAGLQEVRFKEVAILKGSVVIDCFPDSALRYKELYAIVVIDVIRATTTATTAISLGRRIFPARTTDEAAERASCLENPLLVGELGGNMPYGFDVTNSPAQIAQRTDIHRPMVLVSSSGTQLLMNAAGGPAVYIACLRNLSAIAGYIAGKHDRVAILGAGTRGQFRREDQMGCAWVAERLVRCGYRAETPETDQYIARWRDVSPEEVRGGRSAAYLRKSGQEQDLEFTVHHIDDLDVVPSLVNNELIRLAGTVLKPAV